jgi:RNA polymerase sigma factor (TIGR02999 family)
MSASGEVTGLLRAWGAGDTSALDALLPLVQAELRRLARRYMASERRDHTLQTTALVHEAFIRLVDAQQVNWNDRAHFFGIAARLMRRVLVDHARERRAAKRGGGAFNVPFEDGMIVSAPRGLDLLALDSALEALSLIDERQARVVDMRFFAGMTVEETAEALHLSADTVKRDWRLAKLWLLRAIRGSTS